MKTRFILFQRPGIYCCEDTIKGKQVSLRTKDKADALRLLHAKNEAAHQPSMNLQIAQVYFDQPHRPGGSIKLATFFAGAAGEFLDEIWGRFDFSSDAL